MSFKRILCLIKRDLFLRIRNIMFTIVSLGIFLLLFEKHNSVDMFAAFFYAGGFIVTSYAFSDLHDVYRGYAYLTLPASPFEKFFSRWCLSSIIYVVLSILVYSLLSQTALSVQHWDEKQVLEPTILSLIETPSSGIWPVVAKYMVLQPVVFLGAVYFKHHVLLKTGVFVSLFLLLITALVFLVGYASAPHAVGFGLMYLFKQLYSPAYYFFWVLLAPLCLSIAYVRFTECEM